MHSTGATGASSSFTISSPARAVAAQWTSLIGSPGTYSRTVFTASAWSELTRPSSIPVSSRAGRRFEARLDTDGGPTSNGRGSSTRMRRFHHTRPMGAAERTSSSTDV